MNPGAGPRGLRTERVPGPALDAGTRAAMLGLLRKHFDGVDAEDFEADLAAKDGALLLRNGAGRLCGFSTYHFYDAAPLGRPLRAAFFGDTIVERDAWGSPALPAAVIRVLMEEAARVAPRPLYCLLLCGAYRTYHFLPFFCRDYFPGPAGLGEGLRGLRDALAKERFGADFDPAAGIVRLSRGAYAPRTGLSEPPADAGDPATLHFLAANPGWARGDELACLAHLHPDNLTPASRRLLRTQP